SARPRRPRDHALPAPRGGARLPPRRPPPRLHPLQPPLPRLPPGGVGNLRRQPIQPKVPLGLLDRLRMAAVAVLDQDRLDLLVEHVPPGPASRVLSERR